VLFTANNDAVIAVTMTKANSADSQCPRFYIGWRNWKLVYRGKSQASRNSRRRNRSRSQSENKSCWYHRCFGGKASVRNSAAESQRNRKLEADLSPATDSLVVAAHHLIVRDRITDIKFLMDTKADHSCLDHSYFKTRSYSY